MGIESQRSVQIVIGSLVLQILAKLLSVSQASPIPKTFKLTK